jgi:hypothetical protein
VTNTLDWPFAAQGFVLHRTRTVCRSGKLTEQTVYGITSLEPLATAPAALLALPARRDIQRRPLPPEVRTGSRMSGDLQ